MNEDGETFLKRHNNWDIYTGKGYILSVSIFGNKTVQVYVFDNKPRRVECVVRINDTKGNNYTATVSHGMLIENYFLYDKNQIIEKKNNLKEYLAVIHTLPKNIKESLSELVL